MAFVRTHGPDRRPPFRNAPALPAAALLALAAGGASGQVAHEVSEDGHLRVPVQASEAKDGVVIRPADAPFGDEPDWVNDIRRQVGALQIADMNGDGQNDLVVGVFNSNSFPPYDDWHDMIYYNAGGELEDSPSWIAADEIHTGDLAIGDIDGDGHQDVFAISGGWSFSPVRIYFGGPDGPSTAPGWTSNPPKSGWATSGVLFDADNDGDLDAVTTNQGVSPDPYRPMHFFRNDGSGLERTPSWVSAEESIQNGLDVADFDGDGFLDVGVAKWVNFETAVYRNDGGTLEPAPAWTTGDDGTDKGVAWADVDGNGWPDLGVGHDEPSWVFGNDGGELSLMWSGDAPYYGQQEVRFADVNHDGRPDYSEVHFSDGRTHIYLNEGGELSVQPSWTYDGPNVGNTIAYGDINGDGRLDLAIGYSGNPSIRVFYGRAPDCPVDLDGSGSVDVNDFFVFLDLFAAGDDRADFTGDGTIAVDDFFAFLDAFAAGC